MRALVRIVPHDDDPRSRPTAALVPGDGARPDHVAGVHGPSLTLSHLTVRRPVETALDVGTGSGIQALLAARHSERVVATDLNERALGFAAFNAALNGAENVEVRTGSFFEPVAGERFGLVTSQPAVRDLARVGVPLPRQRPRRRRRLARRRRARSRTTSRRARSGRCSSAGSHTPDGDWSAPLREWLAGSGCDAWLLHYGTSDPLTHAADWLRHDLSGDPGGLRGGHRPLARVLRSSSGSRGSRPAP